MAYRLLSGMKVVDLSRFISGPWCAMLLADLGATVVKVERPGRGDDARACGPFHGAVSLYYEMYNRNKKSITLDLKNPGSREVLSRLVQWADVLVENFRPGVIESLGFPFRKITELNSRCVLVSITGFGRDGPYRDRPCFDVIAQAMSGIMDLTGFPDGPPTRTGVFLSDFLAGNYAAMGALAALLERTRTNAGKHVDVSMLESVVSLMETNFSEYALTGRAPTRTGNRRLFAAPVDSFPAADGYVFLCVSTNEQWAGLCRAMGRGELSAAQRFSSPFLRGEAYKEINALVGEWVSGRPVEQVVQLLNRESVPCASIDDVPRVMDNPQLKHSGGVQSFALEDGRRLYYPALPIRYAGEVREEDRRSPVLGQDTAEVLATLGYREQEILDLQAGGVT